MLSVLCIFCFFFSSRRRHTRWPRDWSSDVCSSDLVWSPSATRSRPARRCCSPAPTCSWTRSPATPWRFSSGGCAECWWRSEERRVGKECRGGWGAGQRERREDEQTRERDEEQGTGE